MFWWDAKEQRKGGNGKRKNIRNILERLNNLGFQTNSLMPFLKAALMKMKAVLFSALVTVPYSEPSQTSKMEFSAEIDKSRRRFTHVYSICLLRMFNRLIRRGNNRSYARKQTCTFYLQVFFKGTVMQIM